MTDASSLSSALHIGIDIGGTKTDAVVVDGAGALIQQLRLNTGYGPSAVVHTAVDAATQVAARVCRPLDEFDSVGVGVPGRVDTRTGTVTHAVNLGVEGLELGRQLAARLGTRVYVENDVNAAALGAYHRLTAAGAYDHSMAYLNLGTGLAAGIVVDGRLRRGSRGTAGEIGHIPVDPNGAICSCGQRGCLEASASGSAVLRQWPTTSSTPVQDLKAAADSGDGRAAAVWGSLVTGVASSVGMLVLTVDVDTVVIGGGIATVGEPLLDGVRSELDERAATSPFLASLELSQRVRLVPPGFPSAAVGAAFVGIDAAQPVEAI